MSKFRSGDGGGGNRGAAILFVAALVSKMVVTKRYIIVWVMQRTEFLNIGCNLNSDQLQQWFPNFSRLVSPWLIGRFLVTPPTGE